MTDQDQEMKSGSGTRDDSNSRDSSTSQDFFELAQQDLLLDNALTTTSILDGASSNDPAPNTTTKEPDGFALIEDWDGTLIFGHIDEERHLNDLLDDIPKESSSGSGSGSESEEVKEEQERDETGDTTDEDVPTLPHGIAAIQATQFTPAPTPTPQSSPAKEGRKPPMGHFQNELNGDIQRVAREGVHPSRFSSTSNQATNAHSIIIDHKHKPVPSPHRDFYLVGRERRKLRQRRASSDAESDQEKEKSVKEQQPHQQELSMDDLIDTSTLTDTQTDNTDKDAHLSRWDRIPIGAFSMSQSDFEEKSVNATNPHLLASARSSSSSRKQRSTKNTRPSLPSPLLFPSDGSGQGQYTTPRKKGKSKEDAIPRLNI